MGQYFNNLAVCPGVSGREIGGEIDREKEGERERVREREREREKYFYVLQSVCGMNVVVCMHNEYQNFAKYEFTLRSSFVMRGRR